MIHLLRIQTRCPSLLFPLLLDGKSREAERKFQFSASSLSSNMRQKGWLPIILVILIVAVFFEQLLCAGLCSILWLPCFPEPSQLPLKKVTASQPYSFLSRILRSCLAYPHIVYIDNMPNCTHFNCYDSPAKSW